MVGSTLSHYKILKLLGKGGMGEVYLAEDTRLKRQVALKVLPERVRQNPERLRRSRTEAEAAAKLNHPNIAQIYALEEAMPVDDGADGEPRPDRRDVRPYAPTSPVLFIVMEYVDGRPLSHHIPNDGLPLGDGQTQGSAPTFFGWFIPLADGLAHAHEHGVTRRDLKPGNIMIRNQDGVPKILDFGLARIARPEPGDIDPDAPTVTIDYDAPPTRKGRSWARRCTCRRSRRRPGRWTTAPTCSASAW